MGKIEVSIIIVSYNTRELLVSCIKSIIKNAKLNFEIIVSDNGSTDGTIETIEKEYKDVVLLKNGVNLGFAKANNMGRGVARGKYILFLNPDTELHADTLPETLSVLSKDSKLGAVTCKVILPNGDLDPDTRRSFPTPFVSLTHMLKLDKVFKGNRTFDKYWYGYIDANETHEIDSLQGAYMLTKKEVLDKVGWFDESYFLDGEDIDLCWKIHEAKYKILYYPKVTILHIKKGSKSRNRSLRSVIGGVDAMLIFYKKRLWSKYPLVVNLLVVSGIYLLKVVRTGKYYIS